MVRQTYQLMVVCHCNAVSDHEIRAAVAAGACDAEGLAASCNAGTRCGGCRPVVDAILSETTVTIATATPGPADCSPRAITRISPNGGGFGPMSGDGPAP